MLKKLPTTPDQRSLIRRIEALTELQERLLKDRYHVLSFLWKRPQLNEIVDVTVKAGEAKHELWENVYKTYPEVANGIWTINLNGLIKEEE